MPDEKGISINLEHAKATLDWGLKLLPYLGMAILWYINLDKTVDRSKTDDAKIVALETRFNELQRVMNEDEKDAKALRQHVEDQEKFYLLIRHSN
jgi:hypothetical protein